MEPRGVARRYFDAWNRRDPEAIAGMLAEGGTYSDPAAGPGLVGPAIAGYARTLFTSFPDLSFDIHVPVLVNDQTVAARWTMRGTNTGALAGNPPTGRAVALPGADFIVVADGGIRSVHGYFDQRMFVEQLGLHVSVRPKDTIASRGSYSISYVHTMFFQRTRQESYHTDR